MRIYPVITENTKKLPVYLTGVGIEYKDSINRPYGFKEYQISYISKGKGKFTAMGKTEMLYEGDCFIFRPDVPHSYEFLSDDFVNLWITYSGEIAGLLTDYIGKVGAEVFSATNPALQKNLFDKVYKSASTPDSFFDEKNSALVYSCILKTAENKRNNPVGLKRQRFLPVLEYMEKNFAKSVTLDELSAIIGLSRYRFCSSFKEAFGTSAVKYLIQVRIQKSKEMLLSNLDKTVAEISVQAGFNDVSYFCAVFREYEGVSPKEFRNFQKN